MTVKDIIFIVDENSIINVWQDGEIIATADGKDTIPDECQELTVKSLAAGKYIINLDV